MKANTCVVWQIFSFCHSPSLLSISCKRTHSPNHTQALTHPRTHAHNHSYKQTHNYTHAQPHAKRLHTHMHVRTYYHEKDYVSRRGGQRNTDLSFPFHYWFMDCGEPIWFQLVSPDQGNWRRPRNSRRFRQILGGTLEYFRYTRILRTSSRVLCALFLSHETRINAFPKHLLPNLRS